MKKGQLSCRGAQLAVVVEVGNAERYKAGSEVEWSDRLNFELLRNPSLKGGHVETKNLRICIGRKSRSRYDFQPTLI
jgi:hypothetical protein